MSITLEDCNPEVASIVTSAQAEELYGAFAKAQLKHELSLGPDHPGWAVLADYLGCGPKKFTIGL